MNATIMEQGKKLAIEMVKVKQKAEKHEQKIKKLMNTGPLNFDIFNDEGKFQVQTEFCQIGGCMTDFEEFPTREEALYYAATLTLKGKKPGTYGLCYDCRKMMEDM